MFFRRLTEKKIGELLVENGVFSKEQLASALEVCRQRKGKALSGEVFVELGIATEDDILMALLRQYRFAHISLENFRLDELVVKLVPKEVALKYTLIPVDQVADVLTIAIANPLNLKAVEEVKTLTNCEVTTFIATPSDIKKAVEKYYRDAEGFPSYMGFQ